MNTFSPEFSQNWVEGQSPATTDEVPGVRIDPLSAAQQEAWEELAERVTAARSIL